MPHDQPPPAVPTIADCVLEPAGHDWDAVRVPLTIGQRALDILGRRSGAVIDDPREQVLYWLIRTGSAAVWQLSDIRVLGLGAHVTIPPERRTQRPGPHWRICPGDGQLVTDAHALHAAISDALTPRPLPQYCTRCQKATDDPVKVGESFGQSGAGGNIYACRNCAPLFPPQSDPFAQMAARRRAFGS